jgi:PEP-CTERM motif
MFFTPSSHSPSVKTMEHKVILKTSGFVYGKGLFAATIVAALSFFASPASAGCVSSGTTYCDTTQIEAYKGASFQNTYTGNGFSAGVGDALQSAGNDFATDKLVATLTTHRGVTTLELQYYTSFDGNDEGARYADIFLGNSPTSPNTFGYAISLGDETANGGTTAGFYKNVSSSTEKTSEQIWNSKSGSVYGGAFKGTDGKWRASPTVVTSKATQDSAFTTNIVETTTNADPGYGYLVQVKLSASATDFNTLFGSGLSVFWGTADCSNDAIESLIAFNPTPIPEPVTLSLFGVGVAGAVAMRRRRKSKAA